MAKHVSECDFCNNKFYEGDEYYDFDGDRVCEDCLSEYLRYHHLKTAHAVWDEADMTIDDGGFRNGRD